MKHPSPKDCQHRQHPLEDRTVAPGEDGDIARCGAMAPARHRTVDRSGPGGGDFRAKARDFRLVGGAHLSPDLASAEAGKDPVIGLHHRRACGRGWQAGDDDVTGLGHRLRAVAPGGAFINEGLRDLAIKVAHRQVNAIANQTAGELAADIPKTDESDTDHQIFPQMIFVAES